MTPIDALSVDLEDWDGEDYCLCGREAVDEYEGVGYCGRLVCGLRIQAGLDYMEERG